MRISLALLVLVRHVAGCSGGSGGEHYFIRGSARLPECSEAPVANLDGTAWYNGGPLTILTSGCDHEPEEVLEVCGLPWQMSQTGNDVDILVDHEYEIRGRLCADQLYLEGGWWLPVMNDADECTYSDSDAAEVVIEEEGSRLTVAEDQITGTLVLSEACRAEHEMTLYPHPYL